VSKIKSHIQKVRQAYSSLPSFNLTSIMTAYDAFIANGVSEEGLGIKNDCDRESWQKMTIGEYMTGPHGADYNKSKF
jgi:hypothetical protein